MDLRFHTMLNWFNGLRTAMGNCFFFNATDILQSIGDMHTLTQDSLRAQESAKSILLGQDIEAPIRDSFSTFLPYILVGNKKETTRGAYECLFRFIKNYSIWNPRRDQGFSVLSMKNWVRYYTSYWAPQEAQEYLDY